MTPTEWMDKLKANKDLLRSFVQKWHPSSHKQASTEDRLSMPITAVAAEAACQTVRESIRQKEPSNPVAQFDTAVESNDYSKLNSLLNDAWFGVPESRSCWSIPGFPEAVELMEDPPEDDYNPSAKELEEANG